MIRLLCALGVLFLALGSFLYKDAISDVCEIQDPSRSLIRAPGQDYEISFYLSNSTDGMVRIVGLSDC